MGKKPTPSELTSVKNWSPYLSYTWRLAQLQYWYDTNGANAFYDGYCWTPKATRLCAGRYNVKFIIASP